MFVFGKLSHNCQLIMTVVSVVCLLSEQLNVNCAVKVSERAEAEEEKSCGDVVDYEDDDGEGSFLTV